MACERSVARFISLALFLSFFASPAFLNDTLAADYTGRVTDEKGNPIVNALVEVNGNTTFSKDNGTFWLSVPAVQRFILNISHQDYAELAYISQTPLTDQTWRMVRAQIANVNPKRNIILRDKRSELRAKKIDGAVFTLPANALVDGSGHSPEGDVRAAIATLDVANGEGPGDWAVRSDRGQQDGYLISYGAVFIQFTNPRGTIRYQLRKGSAGELSLPVIPSMLKFAPRTSAAPFWYFDPKDGYWKRAGTSAFKREAKAYVGKVTHLSTINTDIAKFDNAACLKVTLDPSIPFGMRLRIRYHSGGTPFGQTPIFVMNDPVNAAFRLPANTNVLLALIDASNHEFGNLIVEDPVGTALVNPVIDTGSPIPPGNTLWPPAPYTDCKPIMLRLALPQVEIRINQYSKDDSLKDNPSDDYVTWAPTFSVARLTTPLPSSVNVVLTNDAPGQGGDVLFAPFLDPWPVNTTATADTLALSLPGDGSWVPFAIAGKFGSPSINDKDVIIEAHQSTTSGPVIGTKALMVRVRKNANNNLTPSERGRFLFAWRAFRNKLGDNYIQFQEMHRLASTAGDEAHMQPSFLPWHRTMLLHVERELQKLDPSVALHYWNWDSAAPNIFTEDFLGAPGSGFGMAEPVFAASNPLNGWNTDLPFSGGELRRNTADHTEDPAGAMKPLLDMVADWNNFGPASASMLAINSFSDDLERSSHNPAHGWACGGGHITNPVRSAADPLFYLLHSQIDREWAYWQWQKNRFGTVVSGVLTFPVPAHYDNTGNWNTPGNVADAEFSQKGSFLNDGLWPWDGTTGGASNTPEWRPENQATTTGSNIPLSMPAVPMTPFPASVIRNIWPIVPTIPTNAHMIDYNGKFRPEDGLGFSYDDVPY